MFIQVLETNFCHLNKSSEQRENLLNELKKIESFSISGKTITNKVIENLINLGENHSISELVDLCLAKKKSKLIKVLNENIYSNEDCILILRSLLNKSKLILRLSKEYKRNNNIDLTISTAKPPIFWKEKETTKHQIQIWEPQSLKVLIYKINDIELIRYVAKTKKPMIISTGMADLEEIDLAYRTAKKNGCNDISLLYCVSSYPSKINEFNLNNIKILKKRYNCEVGLSDHSNNKIIPAISAGFGAKIFEKHIAIPGLKKSLDYEFSLKGKEINEYKKLITDAALVTKNSNFTRIKSELGNRRFRRSIFSTRKIRKGEKFTEENIKIIRPGHGIDPKYFKNLIGKISKNNYSDSVPLKKKEIIK